jgi:uncharacterized coiled-coil protein SlyX
MPRKTLSDQVLELFQYNAIAETKIAALEKITTQQDTAIKELTQSIHQLEIRVTLLEKRIDDFMREKHQSYQNLWSVIGPVAGGIVGGLVTVGLAEMIRFLTR